jgi:hypothetical protein
MDWKRAIDEERAVLERIVALLLALADFAELACCRGASVGRLVLAILRPPEAVMWQFLDDEPATAATGRSGSTSEELACLAERLRAVAAILASWAKLACPSCGRQCSPSLANPARFLRPRRAASGYDLFGPAHVDTS